MKNKITTSFLRLALAAVVFAMLTGAAAQAQNGRNSDPSFFIFAVTTNNLLISFKANNPEKIRYAVPIVGLPAGVTLLGIDFRPANGVLYGLGSNSQIFTINFRTGVATAVGAPFTPALEGTEFGFDFNPVPDRIRIVSNTGQNLRVNPNTGQVQMVDGRLRTAQLAPVQGIVGAAYTNPDVDPNTGTVLYDIDANADMLVIQNPPNDGILNPVGPLGVDAGTVLGFDIGVSTRNGGFFGLAAFQPNNGGPSRLFSINLATGQAFDLGQIGAGELVRGLAVNLVRGNPYDDEE